MPQSIPTSPRPSTGRRRTAGVGVMLLVVAAVAGAALGFAACTNNGDTNGFTSTASGSGGGSAEAATVGAGGDGGSIFAGSGGGGPVGPIYISPKGPVVKVEVPLTGQTVAFKCLNSNDDTPAASPSWGLSSLDLGSISAQGVFTPNGLKTGTVDVSCTSNMVVAKTKLTILIHASDNQGSVSPQDQLTLSGPPGLSDAQWQFLYPYDKTVFPRGILAPEIHLTSGSSQGSTYFVHIVTPSYEYEGFFTSSPTQTQLQMSQSAWDALANSAAGGKVEVRVSKLANGQKIGPIFRTWTIANGHLHGTAYYNTYDSALAQQTGAMMRIKGNSPTPEVLVGNCTVCHSVSSDGSTAAAAEHSGNGGIFDLSGGQLNPPILWKDAERTAFAALYPKNGEVFVVNGAPGGGYPPNTPGTSTMWYSELRTKTGTLIPNSGIEGFFAMSPVFSHDGTMLAFNDRKATPQGGNCPPFQSQWWPSSLALLTYDALAQKFDNYQVLATPPVCRQYSWPAFTPDNKFVVYQDGTGEDLATWSGNTGKIFAIDVATKQVVFLQNLNGDGYLPQGARDENKNYEPTIVPIASGGYFWVMFTSRRTYGNKLTGQPEQTKRLWISAMAPNALPGKDPTFPAFYIAGQELTSGNSRGFWALNPCKDDGGKCDTGDECCSGHCDPDSFVCGPPTGMCAVEFEQCVTDSDCCDAALQCIGGKCSQIPPN